jgi:hypothetical protein
MYKPLRGFVRGTSVIHHCDDVDDVGPSSARGGCANPILWPRRDELFAGAWEVPISNHGVTASTRKRGRRLRLSPGGEDNEIERLRTKLAESQAVIERWQAVNNQLVAKLKNTDK